MINMQVLFFFFFYKNREQHFNRFWTLIVSLIDLQWRIVGMCRGRWSSSMAGWSSGYMSPCDIVEPILSTRSALLRCSCRILRNFGLLCGVSTLCRCDGYIPSRGKVSHPNISSLIFVIAVAPLPRVLTDIICALFLRRFLYNALFLVRDLSLTGLKLKLGVIYPTGKIKVSDKKKTTRIFKPKYFFGTCFLKDSSKQFMIVTTI